MIGGSQYIPLPRRTIKTSRKKEHMYVLLQSFRFYA